MIVVIGGIKGGSGKTTLATNLTVLRSQDGYKVLLIDADSQMSATSWNDQRILENKPTPWTTIQLSGNSVLTQIKKLSADYDDIIVDVGGHDSTSQRYALGAADKFVMPFLPRSLDIWTAPSVNNLVEEALCYNPKLKTYVVINRSDVRGKDNVDALEYLKGFFLCVPHMIAQRKAFANAASCGLAVSEFKPHDKEACQEMRQVYQYIFRLEDVSNLDF